VVDFDLPAVEIGLQQFVRRTGEICSQQISRIRSYRRDPARQLYRSSARRLRRAGLSAC
jgi:hypothetical protein